MNKNHTQLTHKPASQPANQLSNPLPRSCAQVPELTGDRPLLLKFRPAKKAAAHLRALGLAAPEDGEPGAVGSATSGGGTGLSAGTPPGAAGGLLGAVCGEAGSGAAGSAGGSTGGDVDKDGNSLDPSPRIWLGNIAPTATSKSLHAVLSRCGDTACMAWPSVRSGSGGQPH